MCALPAPCHPDVVQCGTSTHPLLHLMLPHPHRTCRTAHCCTPEAPWRWGRPPPCRLRRARTHVYTVQRSTQQHVCTGYLCIGEAALSRCLLAPAAARSPVCAQVSREQTAGGTPGLDPPQGRGHGQQGQEAPDVSYEHDLGHIRVSGLGAGLPWRAQSVGSGVISGAFFGCTEGGCSAYARIE